MRAPCVSAAGATRECGEGLHNEETTVAATDHGKVSAISVVCRRNPCFFEVSNASQKTDPAGLAQPVEYGSSAGRYGEIAQESWDRTRKTGFSCDPNFLVRFHAIDRARTELRPNTARIDWRYLNALSPSTRRRYPISRRYPINSSASPISFPVRSGRGVRVGGRRAGAATRDQCLQVGDSPPRADPPSPHLPRLGPA